MRSHASGGPRIGAVVVNHDAGAALAGCLDSLLAARVEVVVVDNASTDGSETAAERPGVRLVRADGNRGYGTAANIGRHELDAAYLLVCNADLVVDAAAPAVLATYLDGHPDVALAGPRITEQGGGVYPSARAFPSVVDAIGHAALAMFWPQNRFSQRYKPDVARVEAPSRVDWVSGACFMVRTDAFDAVGGFDEAYFMYVEDLDLCWRLRRAGWETAYVPAARVVHHGGGSSRLHPYRMLVAHHASTWRFARRSLTGARTPLLVVAGFGIAARLAVALAREWLSGALRGPGDRARRH